jgi:hypothetical protein
MSGLLKLLNDTEQVVGPVEGGRLEVIEFTAIGTVEVKRNEVQLVVIAAADGDVYGLIYSGGQDKPMIIVGMLADQVDAARSARDIR